MAYFASKVDLNQKEKVPIDGQRIKLIVSGECEGLPSIDAFSSYCLLQLKMNKVNNVKIAVSRFNIFSDIPRLNIGKSSFTHPVTIDPKIEEITGSGLDMEFDLLTMSRIHAHKINCIKVMVQALLYHQWAYIENANLSVKYYSQGFYQPFRFFYARNLRNKMGTVLDFYSNNEVTAIACEYAFAEFGTLMESMASLLGNKPYLFGNKPSSLDIYLCSSLATILYIHYPNDRLRPMILSRPNLPKYVKRFMTKYGTGKPLKEEKEIYVDTSDRAPTWTIVCAGIVAASAMFGFAYIHGIIRINNLN